MDPEKTFAEKSFRRCLAAGVCSLLVPVVGLGIFLFFALVLPSRFSYNPAAELLRVLAGIALLLPVPLAIVSLVFFIIGVSASRGAGRLRPSGLPAAGLGLAMSTLSASLFVVAALLAPGL